MAGNLYTIHHKGGCLYVWYVCDLRKFHFAYMLMVLLLSPSNVIIGIIDCMYLLTFLYYTLRVHREKTAYWLNSYLDNTVG